MCSADHRDAGSSNRNGGVMSKLYLDCACSSMEHVLRCISCGHREYG